MRKVCACAIALQKKDINPRQRKRKNLFGSRIGNFQNEWMSASFKDAISFIVAEYATVFVVFNAKTAQANGKKPYLNLKSNKIMILETAIDRSLMFGESHEH